MVEIPQDIRCRLDELAQTFHDSEVYQRYERCSRELMKNPELSLVAMRPMKIIVQLMMLKERMYVVALLSMQNGVQRLKVLQALLYSMMQVKVILEVMKATN